MTIGNGIIILMTCFCLKSAFGCTSTTTQYIRDGGDLTIQFQARTVNTKDSSLFVINQILSDDDKPLYTVIYIDGVINRIIPCTSCTFTGNADTEKLSIRLDNVQTSEEGIYKHSVTESSQEVKGCVRVYVYVLGKPTKPSITVSKTPFEGESVTLTCKSSSTTTHKDPNLRMLYDWKVDNLDESDTRFTFSDTKNKLMISNVRRNDAGKQFTCTAKEDVSNAITSTRSESRRLDVYYKPDNGPLIKDTSQGFNNNTFYYAIMNKLQTLTCTVIGGNPKPLLSWSCFTGSGQNLSSGQNISKTWTWIASSIGTCKCTSTQMASVDIVVLDVRILLSPTSPTFRLHSQTIQPSSSVRILRDSTAPITCSSTSFPTPDYRWTYNRQTKNVGQNATLTPSQVTQDGRYNCIVQNTMTPSQGNPENGSNSAFINIQRLYAPNVKSFNVEPVVEGSLLSVECKADTGVPAETTYIWKRKLHNSPMKSWQDIPDSSFNGGYLYKQNINRNDAGTYICTATNVMKPTVGNQQIGSSFQTFILNVLYKTSISRFFEVSEPSTETKVTRHENSTVNLTCIVDSNPGSTISIFKDSTSIKTVNETKHISFTNERVSCDSAGKYRCVGYNQHNADENRPSKELQLYVTCKPRLSSEGNFHGQVRSTIGERAKLEIKIKAYPEPKPADFVWSKRNGDKWDILTDDENIEINISGLVSSLVFLDVKVSDFQRYSVDITNIYGTFHQEFFLQPYGKPNPPENVLYIDSSIQQTSVVITWTPGFHGGLNQTFHVLYKKQSDSNWQEVTKPDERTLSMNTTIAGLEPGTTYDFQMFSSNLEGNSDATATLTFTTIAKIGGPGISAGLIGGIVSGAVAFSIVAIVLVVFFRRSTWKKGKSSRDNNDRNPVYEEENDYGMRDNPMYESAGPRKPNKAVEESPSSNAVEYSTVNKASKTLVSDNEYAVVVKPDKSKGKQTKTGKEKRKQVLFKGEKGVQDGDVYVNAPANVVSTKGETIDENPEPSKPVKNVNKDGLIYADLTFNDQPKGRQKKLVIHGLDSMTEYVEVDFTKKADPLLDSDDESTPPKQ